MPERSSISQTVQIGVEAQASPGVSVAANRKLQSIGIAPGIQIETNDFRPTGQKYRSLVTPSREWTEADIDGQLNYNEIVYLLASALAAATPTQIMDGATPTGAYRWLFQPSSTVEDTVRTFTVEQGGPTRAHRFAYGLVRELTAAWSRTGAEIGGSMLGQRLTDGATLTANPTTVPLVPVLPTQIDVFMDTTAAGLGTTKLLRVLSGEFSLGGRFGPLWTLNSALTSWAAHVETEPDAGLSLTVEADAAGMALLDTLRAGDTRFIRVANTGPRIYTGAANQDYRINWDFAVKVNAANPFGDEDGIFSIEWPFTIVHDAAWGRALQVEVINAVTAL